MPLCVRFRDNEFACGDDADDEIPKADACGGECGAVKSVIISPLFVLFLSILILVDWDRSCTNFSYSFQPGSPGILVIAQVALASRPDRGGFFDGPQCKGGPTSGGGCGRAGMEGAGAVEYIEAV